MSEVLKRNAVREDGRIFWGYDMFRKEIWLTRQQFDSRKQKHLINQRKRLSEYRDKFVSTTNYKRGDVREDGMIFWVYEKSSPTPEKWITKEKFDKLKSYRKSKANSVKNQNRVSEARKTGIRQGYQREDGMLFWCYNKQCSGGMYWVNKEQFDKLQKEARKSKKEWAIKFPHNSVAYPKYRRAVRKNAIHTDHDINDDKKFSHIKNILLPIVNLDIDHIIPLSRGGIHHRYNLRLLPKQLNNSKNNRLDSELTQEQQRECYFWRILTRVLTATYDHEKHDT